MEAGIEPDAIVDGSVACHTAPVHREATRVAVVTGPLLPGPKGPNQRDDASRGQPGTHAAPFDI